MDATAVSPRSLYAMIGRADAPLIIDVRRPPAFAADPRLIVGAERCPPEDVAASVDALAADGPIVVYCVHGHAVSQGVAAALRAAGRQAAILEGGIAAWTACGLPTRRHDTGANGPWVTRERPKVDRIACPWLIRRFIDRRAEIVYVPAAEVPAVAARLGGTAYDIPDVEFSHHGPACSFDAFIRIFAIGDPALDHLARIVRGADTGDLGLTPQSAGLLAFSLGLSAGFPDDHAMLEHGMTFYDALYAWCRDGRAETHGWPPVRA